MREVSSDHRPVGVIGELESGPITLVDYDEGWPAVFELHARRIKRGLAAGALRVEHIGSTAVPGLAAKPIVDILLVVADSASESEYLPRMEAAGFELRVREPDFHEHRMFRTPGREVHVHVFSPDSPEIGRYLTFRDRLRSNIEDRKRY